MPTLEYLQKIVGEVEGVDRLVRNLDLSGTLMHVHCVDRDISLSDFPDIKRAIETAIQAELAKLRDERIRLLSLPPEEPAFLRKIMD